MGDAGVRPMRKMENNNFIKRQINFYQIEHHAINTNTQISFIKHISPDISYSPTQLSDVSQNKIGQNPTYKILQNIGCKNILACSNQENIVISSNNSNMIIEKGLITQSVSQTDLDVILYVDINTTNSIQNGTEAYPFKDIPQALGFIDNVNTSYNYQITLKSTGVYGTANPNNPTSLGVSKNRINMNKIKSLIINGIDKETTLIDIGGTIRNSTVIFNNIGFYNKASQCIYADKSDIFFNNCLFTAQDSETIQHTGVQGQFSKVTLLNCIVEYCNRGLSLYDSEIRTENSIYRNNNV
jgi:hypothetical protein